MYTKIILTSFLLMLCYPATTPGQTQRMGDWEVRMLTTSETSAAVTNPVLGEDLDFDRTDLQVLFLGAPARVESRANLGPAGFGVGLERSSLGIVNGRLQVRSNQFARAVSGIQSTGDSRSRSAGTVLTRTFGQWVYVGRQPANFRFRVDLNGEFRGYQDLVSPNEAAIVKSRVSAGFPDHAVAPLILAAQTNLPENPNSPNSPARQFAIRGPLTVFPGDRVIVEMNGETTLFNTRPNESTISIADSAFQVIPAP